MKRNNKSKAAKKCSYMQKCSVLQHNCSFYMCIKYIYDYITNTYFTYKQPCNILKVVKISIYVNDDNFKGDV
ncbi:hypothetical protein CBEIBR21_17760 [Clostridium beijerinckii]|uniref:Uncharacterized protein n=1 Tax=Clostridium beijerinckii TaxID=1520 RepID=A0A1S9N413_CLOBE|nr:hypothetical protein CBEIBR21_17760 [Clostridium beijerinckii]